MSPVFFVLVLLVLTSAMLSGIFLVMWRTQGLKPHALSWALAYAVATGHWCAHLLIDLFPNWNTYWLVANGLLIIAVSFALMGHGQRVQSEIVLSRLWYPPPVVFGAIVWCTLGAPHAGVQTAIGPAYTAMTLVISAALVLKHHGKPRPAEWGAAIIMLVLAFSQFAASGAGLMQGPTTDPFYMTMYYQIDFLVLPAAYTGMGMFVLFMLASDLSAEMKEIAIIDQLTGLLNRRGYGEAAAKAYATARQTGRPVSVIMTDIDRFKAINDRYGHTVGDHALSHFATVMAAGRRADEIVARVGGEEFAFVLPGSNVEESIAIANSLCDVLAKSPMETGQGPLTMSASFGVATISAKDSCLSDVIQRADAALYRAKDKGRNRVDLEASQIMLLANGDLSAVFG